MEPNEPITLSPAGAARRDAILQDVRAALASRRRRRTAIRSAAIITPVLIVAALIAHAHAPIAGSGTIATNPHTPSPAPVPPRISNPAPTPQSASVPTMRYAAFQEVETRPDLANQWAARGDPHRFANLTDDQVLHELQAAGRPTGLIRTAGHVEFTTQVARIPGDAPLGG